MNSFFCKTLFAGIVVALLPAAGMAQLPSAAGMTQSRAATGGSARSRLKGGSLQLAPRSQADALLQRLGYGAAVTGGGLAAQSRSGDGQAASGDQAPRSQALRMMTDLRSGGAADGDLAAAVPGPGGLSVPGSSAEPIPGTGYAGIPGQNSPYTSTGNAAGVTPYPDYRGLLKRP